MKYFAALGLVVGNGLLVWVGLRYGCRWVDRMLHIPIHTYDPSKPIVLPRPDDIINQQLEEKSK